MGLDCEDALRVGMREFLSLLALLGEDFMVFFEDFLDFPVLQFEGLYFLIFGVDLIDIGSEFIR